MASMRMDCTTSSGTIMDTRLLAMVVIMDLVDHMDTITITMLITANWGSN